MSVEVDDVACVLRGGGATLRVTKVDSRTRIGRGSAGRLGMTLPLRGSRRTPVPA